ncbi:hypothetical protein JCM10213_002427 [Rhodosporidiobolus nylandii]
MPALNLANTAWLPSVRVAAYSLLLTASLLCFIMSTATLVYQLVKTSGYNKPVPSLLTCSILTLAHCIAFMIPVRITASPKRRRLLSLQVECLSLAVFLLFTLASVGRLHSSTPGLMTSCGGYFTCIALQGCLALGWLSFLFLAILFVAIFGGTLHHQRRGHDSSLWRAPFAAFDWAKYAPHGGRGAGGLSGQGQAAGLGGGAKPASAQQEEAGQAW